MATPQQYFQQGAFRVDPASTSQQTPTRLSGGPRGSVQANLQQAPAPLSMEKVNSDATINQATIRSINKMGQSLLEPYIERKQQEMFYEGARRQIEGEALADIVDDQPWYSKIFGPSASAQGARKMAQLRGVDEVVNGLGRDMHELRKLNPDEFQQELFNRLDESATGDARTDAIIQGQVLESSQSLIKAHTKEHYAYNQEKTQEEFTRTALVNAEQLQEGAKGYEKGFLNEDDWTALRSKVANSLQPLEGQTQESYFSSVQSSVKEAMQKGEWHYVSLVEDTGVIDAMPSEMRVDYRDAKRTYENRTMEDLATGEFHLDLAELSARSSEGQISPNQVLAGVKRINEKARKLTGLDRDFLDGDAVEGLIQGNLKGLISERRRRSEAEADARSEREAAARDRLLLRQAVATGDTGNLVSAGVISGTDAQSSMTSVIRSDMANDGADRWPSLVIGNFNKSKFTSTYLENEVQRGFRATQGEDLNSAWGRSMALYATLNEQPGGQAAASEYAGEYAGQAQQAYEMMQAGANPETAYRRTFQTPEVQNYSDTERETALGAIEERFSTGGFLGFGKDLDLTDSSKQQLVDAAIPAMQKFRGTSLTATEQLDRALPSITSKVVPTGKYVVHKNPSDKDLKTALGTTKDGDAGLVFDAAMDKSFKELGIDPSASTHIIQQRSQGKLSFIVSTYEEDGSFNTFEINQDELEKSYENEINKLRHSTYTKEVWGDNLPLVR